MLEAPLLADFLVSACPEQTHKKDTLGLWLALREFILC
jgi:hypothetical protein